MESLRAGPIAHASFSIGWRPPQVVADFGQNAEDSIVVEQSRGFSMGLNQSSEVLSAAGQEDPASLVEVSDERSVDSVELPLVESQNSRASVSAVVVEIGRAHV